MDLSFCEYNAQPHGNMCSQYLYHIIATCSKRGNKRTVSSFSSYRRVYCCDDKFNRLLGCFHSNETTRQKDNTYDGVWWHVCKPICNWPRTPKRMGHDYVRGCLLIHIHFLNHDRRWHMVLYCRSDDRLLNGVVSLHTIFMVDFCCCNFRIYDCQSSGSSWLILVLFSINVCWICIHIVLCQGNERADKSTEENALYFKINCRSF